MNSWVEVTENYVAEHRDLLSGSYVDVLACLKIAEALDAGVNASLTAEYRRYFGRLEAVVLEAQTITPEEEEDELLSPRY